MQELPDSVGQTVESMYERLMDGHSAAAADLLPNATLKQQVGRWPSKLLPCNDFHFLEVAGLIRMGPKHTRTI
jgi:hypothetical protein